MAAGKWINLALGTALLAAALSGVGLFNTWRWYQALPLQMIAGPLPHSFWFGVAVLAGQFLAALLALLGAAWGKAAAGRWRVFLGLAMLLVLHLGSWAERCISGSASPPLTAHATRMLLTLWLVVLLYRLAPNNSSKPTPLRGAA